MIIYKIGKITFNLYSKLSKGIGLLCKSLLLLYIPLYRLYNLFNWLCTPKSNLDCIRISVKKAIRIITFNKRQEHTVPLFKELEIIPLDSFIKFKQETRTQSYYTSNHNGWG